MTTVVVPDDNAFNFIVEFVQELIVATLVLELVGEIEMYELVPPSFVSVTVGVRQTARGLIGPGMGLIALVVDSWV